MTDLKETTGAVETTENAILAKVQEFGGDESVVEKLAELGVEALEDLSALTESDLVSAGMKLVPARKLLASLEPATVVADPTTNTVYSITLSSPPDSDMPWLEAIRQGHKLKNSPMIVIPGIRAAISARSNLFEVPNKLIKLIKAHADANDEPNPPIIKDIRRMLQRNRFAEVIEAIEGFEAADVTDGKDEMFARIQKHLWPALDDYRNVLAGWVQQYNETQNSLGNIGAVLAGRGRTTPPPSTGALHDYGEAVIAALNKVYASDGAAAAAGMAGWARKIIKYLDDNKKELIVHTGAANEEQLLRMLEVESTAATVRMERNIVEFVMSIIDASKQTAGDAECDWFIALHNLGNQIPWDTLTGKSGGVSSLAGTPL